MEKKLMIILVASLSVVVGVAYASNSYPADGNPTLTGDGTSGIQLKISNTNNKQNSITFQNLDNGQVYKFRYIGDNFQLAQTAPDFRLDMHIENGTGNIGIGHDKPKEKLDVNGNIKLNGNILSNGDICIGSCP